jgi:hypothetical protein
VGIRCADHVTPSIRKSWRYGRYSSLADYRPRRFSLEFRVCCVLLRQSICVWFSHKLSINLPPNDRQKLASQYLREGYRMMSFRFSFTSVKLRDENRVFHKISEKSTFQVSEVFQNLYIYTYIYICVSLLMSASTNS